jgi:hypothetical protein
MVETIRTTIAYCSAPPTVATAHSLAPGGSRLPPGYSEFSREIGYRTPLEIYRERDSSGGQPPDEKRIEIARKKLIAG